jgi:predicted N-acetyltransferase YhbS
MALNSHRQLLAYYTLASASVLLDQLPSAIQKKLPRYAAVPAVRMGRLAVDKSHRQKGLGSALLADALTRACRSEITAFALIVLSAPWFYEPLASGAKLISPLG